MLAPGFPLDNRGHTFEVFWLGVVPELMDRTIRQFQIVRVPVTEAGGIVSASNAAM